MNQPFLEPKKDLLTGEKFQPKRSNQQFARPENRIIYNSNKAKLSRLVRSNIDKPVLKNFMILTKLMGKKKEAVFHKQFLLGAGYAFDIHNHLEVYENKRHYAIYNFILIHLDNDHLKIIQNDAGV